MNYVDPNDLASALASSASSAVTSSFSSLFFQHRSSSICPITFFTLKTSKKSTNTSKQRTSRMGEEKRRTKKRRRTKGKKQQWIGTRSPELDNRDVPLPCAEVPSPRSLNIHFDLTASSSSSASSICFATKEANQTWSRERNRNNEQCWASGGQCSAASTKEAEEQQRWRRFKESESKGNWRSTLLARHPHLTFILQVCCNVSLHSASKSTSTSADKGRNARRSRWLREAEDWSYALQLRECFVCSECIHSSILWSSFKTADGKKEELSKWKRDTKQGGKGKHNSEVKKRQHQNNWKQHQRSANEASEPRK